MSKRRARVGQLVGGFGCVVLAACTYDFDEFIGSSGGAGGGTSESTGGAGTSSGGAQGSGGAPARGGAASEEAGASSTEGGAAGDGGGTTGSGTTDGGASDGGETAIGSAGEAGARPAGGSSGGSAAGGGTAAGGNGAGGNSSAGKAGSGGSAGQTGGGSGGSGFDCKAVTGTSWNGHCYFVTASKASFPASRTACAAAAPSAHLVTIADAAEQELVETTFLGSGGADRWIGLSLADTSRNPPAACKTTPASCPFSWVTSEALAYTHWGAHSATDVEPNYTGSCVRLQRDTRDWADLECSNALTAICEVDEP